MSSATASTNKFDLSSVYQPSERQRVFHSCPADIILFGGAAGGGKSEALLWEAFIQCLELPGNRALLLRRSFPELNRSLIQRSLQKFPRQLGKYVASEKSWHFINGSILEFGYCERENDVYQYQSAEYGFIGFDELTHFTYPQWDYLVNSRLRSALPGAWPRVRAASNPGNVGHAWVKEMFIDGKQSDTVWTDERGRRLAFIPAKVTDNPWIVKYDPGYIKRLDSLDEKWRRALRDGDWDVFAGQFFDMWDPDIHVVPYFEPPRHWPRYRAMDWGFAKPYSIGWYAVNPATNQLYRYRELYGYGGKPNEGSRESAEQVARKVKEIEHFNGEFGLIGPADPACWTSSGHTGPTIADTFLENGVTFVRADNERINGWAQCRNRLATELENPRNGPGFIVADTCTHFIRTVPSLVHSESRPEDLDTEGEDHVADEWRYMCMFHFHMGEGAAYPMSDDFEDFEVMTTPKGELLYFPKRKQEQEWWEY